MFYRLNAFISSHMGATYPAHFIIFDMITLIISGEKYELRGPSLWSLVHVQAFPSACCSYFNVSDHIFKPIQNNNQNYSFLRFSVQVFRNKMGRQTVEANKVGLSHRFYSKYFNPSHFPLKSENPHTYTFINITFKMNTQL
jgi:hypothetical protein